MDITFPEDDSLNLDDQLIEDITPRQVLQDIQAAWLNERFAPEILPNKTDLIECMLGQVHHMEENIKRLKKNDPLAAIHQLEVDRIRYIISSYMRIRLDKIELFTKEILDREEHRGTTAYLSREEHKFAVDFLASQETLFKTSGLIYMMGTAQQIDWDEMLVKPNLNSYVFLKVKEAVSGLIVGNDTVDLDAGSIHIMSYNPVAELITNGTVNLL